MSVIPKPAPTCDAVLAAVAGGSVTVPALVAATGRTRCAVNHAVARLRSRGLVSGTSRDGSLALTGAGRAALAGDTASALKAGRRPTTAHLALALVDLGVATVAAMAEVTGVGRGTLSTSVRKLVRAGRLTRTGFAYRLTGAGAEVLAEYTRTWGPPAGLPDAETARRAADDVAAARRRRTARGGRRRTDGPRRKPARRPVRRRAAAAAGTTTGKPRVEPVEVERAARVEPVEVERVARVSRTAPAEIKRVERRAPVRLGPVPRRRPPFEAPTAPVLRGYASDHGLPANPTAARYAAARRRAQSLAPASTSSSASSEGFFS